MPDAVHPLGAAGPRRNAVMADRLTDYRGQGCDALVLAFPGGKGTANMVAEARRRGLPAKEVTA